MLYYLSFKSHWPGQAGKLRGPNLDAPTVKCGALMRQRNSIKLNATSSCI